MPTTTAAIQAILSIKKEFNLVTGDITLTDQSPYTTSLTLTAPWTIKGLFKVIDPAGETCYINAGYDTDTYTSPDISITNLSSPPYDIDFAIPLTTGDDYIFGTYTVFYKVQCIESVSPTGLTVNTIQQPSPSNFQNDLIEVTGVPITGDLYVLTYKGVSLSYEALGGDTSNDVSVGLAAVISAYQLASPSSLWATELEFNGVVPSSFVLAAKTVDTPFVLTPLVIPSTPSETTYAQLGGGDGEEDALVQCYPSSTTESYEANCIYALIKSTDTTQYGAYQSLTRSHVLIPPPLSGQDTQTANSQIITYSVGIPYTGTWSWRITSTITYARSNNVYITVEITGEGTFNVACDTNFCKLLCIVRNYYTYFFSQFGKVPNSQDARNWLLVESNFNMAYYNKVICGKPDSEIQKYIDAIYEIPGINQDCGCGCDDETPSPIIPTNTINGQDGTDGTDGITPAFRVNGGFVQVSVDNSATWQNLYSLASVSGTNGTNGTDGADGVAVLFNDTTTTQTAGTTQEIIKTYTLPANTLSTNGSYLEVSARAFTDSANTFPFLKFVAIYFNVSTASPATFNGEVDTAKQLTCRIIRISNTTVRVLFFSQPYTATAIDSGGDLIGPQFFADTTMAGLNLTTTAYDITLQADGDTAGDIKSNLMTVTYYKK